MEFVLYSAQASFSWPRVDPGPAASASIFSVMRVGHTLLASIVLTFSGRCDEVFDGNNAGDIRHYCENCYKCFSVEDFASCKCCRYIRSLSTLPF